MTIFSCYSITAVAIGQENTNILMHTNSDLGLQNASVGIKMHPSWLGTRTLEEIANETSNDIKNSSQYGANLRLVEV